MNEPKLKWTDHQYRFEKYSISETFFGKCRVAYKMVDGERYWEWSASYCVTAPGEIIPKYVNGRESNKTEAMLKAEQAVMEALKPYVNLYDKLTNGEEKK